jgi:hypothetical protein
MMPRARRESRPACAWSEPASSIRCDGLSRCCSRVASWAIRCSPPILRSMRSRTSPSLAHSEKYCRSGWMRGRQLGVVAELLSPMPGPIGTVEIAASLE